MLYGALISLAAAGLAMLAGFSGPWPAWRGFLLGAATVCLMIFVLALAVGLAAPIGPSAHRLREQPEEG
ncbi:MAG: hypothetical protein ACOCTI_00940 [Phycisphaeraceae bacterium]